MRLSWNEVRVRAATFSENWKRATYEKGETHSFYNDFFGVFGIERRNVARYEEHVVKLDSRSGFIDLFWPGVLIAEQKSAGRDLRKARAQAGEYFDALPVRERPRYILVSDFQTFELRDLDEGRDVRFALSDLSANVEEFGFILGVHKRAFRDQNPANIEAAELVGAIHDALEATGYSGYDLERFLVRTVFCLFADDTGIFDPRDIFFEFLEVRTSEDGADLGAWLSQLFQVLDTPEEHRLGTLDEDLARFPHVNGALFHGPLRIPAFDSGMRNALLDACRFDWSNISPAIFGALFQSVMDPLERRAQGAHYTTEQNIRKVIEPLFMDDLRAEFVRLQTRKDTGRHVALRRFQERLGQMRFFDPACGCGNFLVIAYRELRGLEIDVLKEMYPREGRQLDALAETLSVVDVDQFYGLEIGEFPVRIAETAMWMMDHIMNNRLSLEFGQSYVRIPLEAAPHILQADALETDWANFLQPEKCSFVFGNPPFVGAKFQTVAQRAQVHRIAALGGTGGTLDYVTAWLIKAGEYARGGAGRVGFVATNSITQGEQVGQLWPILFDRCEMELAFAHRTFAWGSDARGKAHVHVAILGLARRDDVGKSERRLFSYPDIKGQPEESRHIALSPYLLDASGLADPHLTVREVGRPINGLRRLITGTQPIDNGHYIFRTAAERDAFLDAEPGAAPYLRPFLGAKEFVHGRMRWILALQDVSPATLKGMPIVRARMQAVRAYRLQSQRANTVAIADFPTKYNVEVIPDSPFLAMPEVSSERREYAPIGWLEPPVIPSNKLRLLPGANLAEFAVLTSAMHMAWMRGVTGRMKSDYSYSVGVVYNTFPMPPDGADLSSLDALAQAVIDARQNHAGEPLANLYDPDLMPAGLRKAHRSLDRAVDRLYRRKPFASERERLEYLFTLYEKMRSPLTASVKDKRRRRSGRAE